MDINFVILAVNLAAILIEFGLPIAFAVYLVKKFENAWIMIVTGVVMYAVAQLIHIPALSGMQTLFANGVLPTPAEKLIPFVNAAIVGLLAAMIEEGVRWIAFRVTLNYAKPFRSAVSFGIGSGGAELLVLGALVAYNLGTALFYNPAHQLNTGVSSTVVQATLAQIQAYWQSTWYVSLMSIFENLMQFTSQVVFSIFVWKAVTRNYPVWFFTAILYHIIVSGITTLLAGLDWTFWQVEGMLAIIMVMNIFLIYSFWEEEGGLESEGGEDEDDEEYDDDEDDEDEEEKVKVKKPAKTTRTEAKAKKVSAKRTSERTKKASAKSGSKTEKPVIKKRS